MTSKLLIDISNNDIEVLDISNLTFDDEYWTKRTNKTLVKDFTRELLNQVLSENESIVDFTTDLCDLNYFPKNVKTLTILSKYIDEHDVNVEYHNLEQVNYFPSIYRECIFECAPNIKKINITLTDESMYMVYALGDFQLDEVRSYFNNIFFDHLENNMFSDKWFIDNQYFILSKENIKEMLDKNIEINANIISDGVTHKFDYEKIYKFS
jgi:hypothetical protein